MTNLSGVIHNIARFNKCFIRLIVFSDGRFLTVIIKTVIQAKIRCGDHISFCGEFRSYKNQPECHAINFHIRRNIKSSCKEIPASVARINDGDALSLLSLRSYAIRSIHSILGGRNFFAVQSPTVTSNWVRGDTKPFGLDFYGAKCYLSISNMLYHQIMLSSGFGRIYEIGKLHRMEKPASRERLAEFTILDIGMTGVSLEYLMELYELVITAIVRICRENSIPGREVIDDPSFQKIDYRVLLRACGIKDTTGSQINTTLRNYLEKNFKSFVWITGFEETTRPFYTKSLDGYCIDCQLWYRGRRYIAAGGEVERDIELIENKIIRSGKDIDRYRYYLDHLSAFSNIPKMSGIGLGLELLLKQIMLGSHASDFTWFPRYNNRIRF